MWWLKKETSLEASSEFHIGEQVSIVSLGIDSIFLGGNLICLSPFIMGSYGSTTFVNILFDSLLLDDNLFKSQSFESTVLEM